LIRLNFSRALDKLPILILCALTSFFILSKSPHGGFGDDGIYIKAGFRVISGDEIYTDGFRAGAFGATVIYALSKILNFPYSWIIFQIFSVSAVIGIVFLVTRDKDRTFRWVVALFAVSSAPVREMLHNHQITASVIFLAIWPFFYSIERKILLFCGIFSVATAIDLKPHIAIFLVIALALGLRKLSLAIYSFAFLLAAHLVISFCRHEFIDISWLKVMVNANQAAAWGESISFWPLLERISFSSVGLRVAEYLTIGILLTLVLNAARKRQMTLILILISFLTYFMSYSHFYDLILIAALTSICVFWETSFWGLLFMGFGLVPGLLFDPKNFVFWLFMMGIFLLYANQFNSLSLWKIVNSCLLVLVLHLALTKMSLSFENQVRLRSSLYMILSLGALIPLLQGRLKLSLEERLLK
jgi:hypothetical protein